jgi:hypothetical protein
MSSSNAAAIRRRANVQPTTPQSGAQPTAPQSVATQQSTLQNKNSATAGTPSQMSLQQVIATVDKRLTQLERIATTSNPGNTGENNNQELPMVVEEFNSRFEMIVTEINSLKDVVMKLQSYTMEVNKMLVDERIHILSDLGNNSVTSSTMHNNNNNDDALSLTSADLKKMVEQELHTNSE